MELKIENSHKDADVSMVIIKIRHFDFLKCLIEKNVIWSFVKNDFEVYTNNSLGNVQNNSIITSDYGTY